MGNVIILQETVEKPITLMGQRAGICWESDILNAEKNYKRGLSCLEAEHGRVLEYVNVEMILEGYSARVIREWYTHIGGAQLDYRQAQDMLIMESLSILFQIQ